MSRRGSAAEHSATWGRQRVYSGVAIAGGSVIFRVLKIHPEPPPFIRTLRPSLICRLRLPDPRGRRISVRAKRRKQREQAVGTCSGRFSCDVVIEFSPATGRRGSFADGESRYPKESYFDRYGVSQDELGRESGPDFLRYSCGTMIAAINPTFALLSKKRLNLAFEYLAYARRRFD